MNLRGIRQASDREIAAILVGIRKCQVDEDLEAYEHFADLEVLSYSELEELAEGINTGKVVVL